MSNELMVKEYTVVVPKGSLKITPMGLVQHHLPGARMVDDRILEAPHPIWEGKKLYANIEALVGMVHYAQDKGLHPITDMYLIPSNSPGKVAGFKVKYSSVIERGRSLPGFLGSAGGVTVKRKHKLTKEDIQLAKEAKEVDLKCQPPEFDVVRLMGELAEPGDTVIGAWARIFIANAQCPIEWEVSMDSFKGSGPNWTGAKANWMICKVALDQCFRLKLGVLGLSDDEVGYGETIEVPTVSSEPQQSLPFKGEKKDSQTIAVLKPGEMYEGKVVGVQDRRRVTNARGKEVTLPAALFVSTGNDNEPYTLSFYSRPEELKKLGDKWIEAVKEKIVVFSFKRDERDNMLLDHFEFVKTAEAKGEPQPQEPTFKAGVKYVGTIDLIGAPDEDTPGIVIVATEFGELRICFKELPEAFKKQKNWSKLQGSACAVTFKEETCQDEEVFMLTSIEVEEG